MTTEPAADGYLAELAARLEVSGSAGEPSSAPILDAGADGLDFFRRFGPARARYQGRNFDFDGEVMARYDAQREIAFAKLRADAQRLESMCSDMHEVGVDLRNSTNSIFDYWRGDTAEIARGSMGSFLSSSGVVWEQINGFADVLLVVCDAAERVVFDKANAVHRLAADQICGLTHEDVRLLVDCAKLKEAAELPDSSLGRLAELCDVDITQSVCRANPDVLDMVLGTVRTWLDTAFVPFYDARMAVFDAACEHAESDLAMVWHGLTELISQLSGNSFHTKANTSWQPAVSTATSAAAVPQPATPHPATQQPVTPQPATPQPVTVVPPQVPAPTPVQVPVPAAGSVSDRLNPSPPEPLAPGNQYGAAEVGMRPEAMGTMAPAANASAAGHAVRGQGVAGYGYVPYVQAGGQGGDIVHKRKVTLSGSPVREVDATPTAIGAADDAAAYNEAAEYDDHLTPVAQAPPEQADEVAEDGEVVGWQLGEDGELREVRQPRRQEERSHDRRI